MGTRIIGTAGAPATGKRETMANYRLLDHTADLGFEVEAPSRDALFERAVLALADVIAPIAALDAKVAREIAVEGDDDVRRLHALLVEELFLFETEKLLPCRAWVKIDGDRVAATLFSAVLDRRHPIERVVKAVTYHAMEVERAGDAWRARVILDL
jgi:SHS2 domain-containing protein